MTLRGLRVALVGPLPPPAGGMANQTRQLAELLAGSGAAVELVQTNRPPPAWIEPMRGLRAVARLLPYLSRLWGASGRSDVVHLMANSGWSWHLHAAPAIWVARMRRTPVVVNYRGGEADTFLRRSARAVRFSMARAAALVVPSGFLQQVFAAHGMRAGIVPNIVDLARFRPLDPGAVREPTLMVARNLEPIYDNATALEAFAQVVEAVPMARLLVAGTGPEEAALRALARRLAVEAQVDFAGRLDRDQMAARLRACAVSINPSRVDNMPNSVLEALASGVPVVSTNVGGVPYIVHDGQTALLVAPGDPQAMSQAIVRLLVDAGLADRLRQAGLEEVQRYTWSRVCPVLTQVYRSALGRSAGRTACASGTEP